MNHRIILTILLLLASLTVAAQSYSPCYTNNIAQGDAAYKQGKYSEAKTYYATAKKCAGGNPTAAQQKINNCDAKLKAQQEAAEAKKREEQEEMEVKRNAEEEAKNCQTIKVNGLSFKMKLVEGGIFTMGCTSEQGSDCDSDEKPSHSVTLGDYWIGETEVTQALWRAVMGSEPNYNGGWTNEYGKGDAYPAYRVSWDDCQEFIRKLNQLTGKTFRLPTEAEWEYAARGGKKSGGYKYSGSNSLGDVAWYTDNSSSATHPVKTKAANELGLYDMSGNVWEWCSDWYGSYSSSSQTNPAGPSSGSCRVNRGGSWNYSSKGCRFSHRYFNKPSDRNYSLGFRLVLVQ